MKDLSFSLKVNIVSSLNDCVFWGKSCHDILMEEFKDFIPTEKADYNAFVSADCPLTCKKTIFDMIVKLQDNYKIKTIDEKIVVINNNSEGLEIVDDSICNLNVANNRHKIEIGEVLKNNILNFHIDNGVYIVNPQSVFIDFFVEIEKDVTIYPNNFITGNSKIKTGCVLMPNNSINNTSLAENVTAMASTFNDAIVGKNTAVGPNAYLRPMAIVGENCKIGDFVEIKNATIGNGTKVSHLSYVGDAIIGENCNIGCGAIFVNYNGKTKSKTLVGNNCFIGSNCNIIAPVVIENDVFIAAGTTVTQNLPYDAFCIGRVKAEIKANLAKKYLKK